jgi:hypothetical protein
LTPTIFIGIDRAPVVRRAQAREQASESAKGMMTKTLRNTTKPAPPL